LEGGKGGKTLAAWGAKVQVVTRQAIVEKVELATIHVESLSEHCTGSGVGILSGMGADLEREGEGGWGLFQMKKDAPEATGVTGGMGHWWSGIVGTQIPASGNILRCVQVKRSASCLCLGKHRKKKKGECGGRAGHKYSG